jgi:hypothetical protein
MKLPELFRPFNETDWMGLAGASPLADGSGPFIAEREVWYEDQRDQVEVVVSGDASGKVDIGFVLGQGEPLSLRLDERGEDPVGITEIARHGLKVEEAEALLTALFAINGPISVTLLTAMGFRLL